MNAEEKNLQIMSKAGNYHRWIYRRIKGYLGKRVLEVGCGIGNMTELILDKRMVVGTEINSSNLKKAKRRFSKKRNFTAINYDISKGCKELKKYRFDTIVCVNVLEHIKNDVQSLKNMREALGRNGRLVLLVPANEWAYGTIDKADQHYRRYSKAKLNQKLDKSGFKIIKERYMNLPGLLGWYYHGKLLKIKVHKENDLSLFDKLAPIFQFIEGIISPPAGLSLIAVCEKK